MTDHVSSAEGLGVLSRNQGTLQAYPSTFVPQLVGLGLAILVAASGVFSLAVLVDAGPDQGLLCLLATSVLAVTALPLALLRRIELYEPLWLVLLIVAIGVTGKAFYLVFGPADRVGFLLLTKEPRDLHFAALIMALGLLGFSFGYLGGLGRFQWQPLSRWMQSDWDRRRILIATGAMVGVGLLSFVLFILKLDTKFDSLSDLSSPRMFVIEGAKYRGAQGYLRWGAMFTELGFYLLFTYWVSLRRRFVSVSGFLICLLALLVLAFPIFVSTRLVVLVFLTRCVMIWIILRGAPRARYLAAIALAGLLLVGTMLGMRRGASTWQDIRSDVGVEGVLEFTVGSRHFLDLTKTAHILDAVPERFGYRHGETFFTWLVAPIPRSIWPEKPPIGVGKELGPVIFGTPELTGVPPGIVAELFLNWGLPAVFVGLILLGTFLRALYETFRPWLRSSNAVLLYSVLSTRIVLDLMAGHVSGSMSKLLQELIPLALVMMLCSHPVTSASGFQAGAFSRETR